MTKVRDATTYLRDRTIDGMNSGSDLWTLMRDVTLPTELALPQVHGKVPWIVRAIWEEHVGWFRYESTTELYDVPPSAVWPDIVESGGGTARSHRAGQSARARRDDRSRRCTSPTSCWLTHPGDADALRVKQRCTATASDGQLAARTTARCNGSSRRSRHASTEGDT